VLGVPCFRSEAEVDFSEDRLIYVDLPGYSLSEQAEQDRIAKVLEQLNIDSRVLVMNAAYESGVLHRFAESGERLGARFQILTHLDELDRIGKLWAYLLDTQRQLLLFSNGQNIAGDRIDDAFGFLIERTFPR
jgi:flagellar biosynthesis GTPase FlhF